MVLALVMRLSIAGRCKAKNPRSSRGTGFPANSLLVPWSLPFSPVSMRVWGSEKKFPADFPVLFPAAGACREKQGI